MKRTDSGRLRRCHDALPADVRTLAGKDCESVSRQYVHAFAAVSPRPMTGCTARCCRGSIPGCMQEFLDKVARGVMPTSTP
ncbi:MAG: hypothetical protein ING52_11660 [Burkholderiales bacterium]|nr:hypothetical protein [Burkholderiales bacterium]